MFAQAAEGKVRLIGHNVGYDLLVLERAFPGLLPDIFKAFDHDCIGDTMVREQLIRIAAGKSLYGVGLGKVCQQYGVALLDKSNSSARTYYGQYRDLPIEYWPASAIEYAKEDAIATYSLYRAQKEPVDHYPQVAYDLALKLMSAGGFRVDPKTVEQKRDELQARKDELEKLLLAGGILTEKRKANMAVLRDIAAVALREAGIKPALTDTGEISVAADKLEGTDDERLEAYTEYKKIEKLLSTYLKPMLKAEGGLIHASFNVLVNTGRTSCRSPNLQNLPRDAELRECFVPSEGNVLCAIDYDTAEMRSLAQVMTWLGIDTPLADVFQDPNADPHTTFAASLLGINKEEAFARKANGDQEVLEARQSAKAANFGFPGGMGVPKFILTQKKQRKVRLKESEATRLRNAWVRQWNMGPYFKHVSRLDKYVGELEQFASGRKRGKISYCNAANSYFQGLTADGAKLALFNVTREMFTDPNSVLYGCRVVNFVHDEIIAEFPEEKAHECALRMKQIMVESMNTLTPDIPATCEAALMRRWYKGAKPVYNSEGELIPWEPKEK
jgi:DNA polymerase-1